MILYLAGSTTPDIFERMTDKVEAPNFKRGRDVELLDAFKELDKVCANHFLFTYADPTARRCAEHFCTQSQRRLFIDSGAFSVWSKGVKVKLEDYIAFCKQIKDKADKAKCPVVFAALDEIAGKKADTRLPTKPQFQKAFDKGWENYEEMKRQGIEPCLMTFHQGEAQSCLDKIAGESDYFAVAPRKNLSARKRLHWLKWDVFDYIDPFDRRDGTLNKKIHGLGVSSFDWMKQFPFASVDTTAFLRGTKDRKLRMCAHDGLKVATPDDVKRFWMEVLKPDETREQRRRRLTEMFMPEELIRYCVNEGKPWPSMKEQAQLVAKKIRDEVSPYGVPGELPDREANSGRYWLGSNAMQAYVWMEQLVTEHWRNQGLILDDEQIPLLT